MTKRRTGPYICDDCAKGYGGEWPDGHRGLKHEGDCDYCGHRWKMLNSISDWKWRGTAGEEAREEG